MNRSFHISTMGCQMNEYHSDYLSQALICSGYQAVQEPGRADLILINSCTVRAKAEQKAYSLLGRMLKLKKKRPDIRIGLLGCLAQQEGERLLRRFPELDLVLGPREIRNINSFLAQMEETDKSVSAVNLDLPPTPFLALNGYFKGRIKSFISIMEGCNNFCSYCIVPYVRGREMSRAPGDIHLEALSLVEQGVKEITLLGQNVNSYFYPEGQSMGFPGLLKTLDSIDGLKRIRFTTSHPKDLSPELIRCFKELDKLCPHIHLPFQAGSDRILKKMNRGYTRAEYMELIAHLRDVRPDMAITSDVMVGFPGETEENFAETLDLVEKIEFDNLYSFKYSDRKGTPAEKMPHKVEEKEKNERLSLLQERQKDITLKKNHDLEGRQFVVLVEGQSKKGGQWTGRTDTYKVVNFKCNNNVLWKLVNIKVKNSYYNSLRGEFINLCD